MKVRMALTLDVDPDEWARVKGTSPDRSAVRADVTNHTLDVVQQATLTAPFQVIGLS